MNEPDSAVPPPVKRHSWLRRITRVVLAIVLGVTLVWWVLLYLFQTKMIFPADMAPRPPVSQPPRGTEVLELTTTAGKVEAWFTPPPRSRGERTAPLAVIFHGNAEIVDQQEDMTAFFGSLGFAVLVPEYPGYGRSAGKPSQTSIRDVCSDFLKRAAEHPDVDPSKVLFFGRSIGGAVAIDLAGVCEARQLPKPTALITVSTVYSIRRMANHYLAPGLLVKNPYRNDLVLPTLHIPILMFHGTQDDIIPVEDGRNLHALVPGAAWIEFDCDHNDFPGRGNESRFEREIIRFLRDANLTTPATQQRKSR